VYYTGCTVYIQGVITSVDYSSSSHQLCSSSDDRSVCLWYYTGCSVMYVIQGVVCIIQGVLCIIQGVITSFDYSSSTHQLCSSSDDSSICLWYYTG